MKKYSHPLGFLALAFLLFCCGQTDVHDKAGTKASLTIVEPATVGVSSERLTRIDNLFQEYVDHEYCAGASAIIARKGKIVYYKAIGYGDLESKTLLEKDAIFRVASQTKAITSVAIMILYEEGKFLLDDPVSKYLPEFSNQGVLDTFNETDSTFSIIKANKQVTIRDLLTHTSGYGYPGSLRKAMNALYAKYGINSGLGSSSVLKEEMKKIANLPLAHQPGEKFTYGLSTDILGYLVEELSGMSLDEFFHVQIFKPLGMGDTYFYLPEEKHDRLIGLYDVNADGNLFRKTASEGFNTDYPNSNGTFFSGGGGLSSTAYDYAIFMQMFLNGGTYNGIRLLSRSTIDMMIINHIGDLGSGSLFIPGEPDKFGLGFEIISPPGCYKIPINEGAYGWGGAFGSLYWIDPEEELIAQLVIQKVKDYGEIRGKFITTVYQALID